jgi:hypothetical protein
MLWETYRFKTDWTVRLTVGDQSDTDHSIGTGTFEQTGTGMTFTFPDGTTFPGTIVGKTVTIMDSGTAFVYVKP